MAGAGTRAAKAAAAGGGLKGAEGDFRPIGAEDWTRDRAAHLLERAGFGGPPAEVEALYALGPLGAVRHLVRYHEVQDVSHPAFRETGIYPSDSWTPVHNRRAFAQVLFGTVDKLPPA